MRPALYNIIRAPIPEADLLIDYMIATGARPQGNRAFSISSTIRRMRRQDLWSPADLIYFPASHDANAGLFNWKNPATFKLTTVSSPTHTPDRGYAGNGTSSYLDTGWAPSTHAVQFALNSGCLGCYVNAGTDTAEASPIQFGSIGGNGLFVRARGTSDTLQGRVNQASSDSLATVATNRGLSVVDRSGASAVTGYKAGVSVGTSTTAAGSLPTQSLYIGALNNGGSAANFATQQIAFAFVGASMTAAKHAALNNIVETYLSPMGAL